MKIALKINGKTSFINPLVLIKFILIEFETFYKHGSFFFLTNNSESKFFWTIALYCIVYKGDHSTATFIDHLCSLFINPDIPS